MWDERGESGAPEGRAARADVPASLLSARRLMGLPVRTPDGFGGAETVGEVREVYVAPDRKRLLGLAVWRAANVLGGGDLLWLPDAGIGALRPDEVRIAGQDRLRAWSLRERADATPHRLEMLRGRPLSAPHGGGEAGRADCLLEPNLRCILGATCDGEPAVLLPPPCPANGSGRAA